MITIIYEDKDLLVCFKPPGIPTQTASLSTPDVVSMVKTHLVKTGASKDPYLGLIHRLDQPVSGLLVLAKNKKTASLEITKKQYYALCQGDPVDKQGKLYHYLWKNPKTNMAEVVDKNFTLNGKKEAKEAVLSYEVIKNISTMEENKIRNESKTEEGIKKENIATASLMKVNLETGRFHQIRAQFSAIGHPLLGDLKYGSEESKELSGQKGIKTIALCAYRLEFIHPGNKKKMEFQVPEELLPLWIKE